MRLFPIFVLLFSASLLAEETPTGSLTAQCLEEYNKGQFEKALDYCHRAATSPRAQYILGKIYSLEGISSTEMKKAYDFFALAANQNHADAQFIVALCYQNGLGVPQNSSRAAYWYRQARLNGLDAPALDTPLTRNTNTLLVNTLPEKTEQLEEAAENGVAEAEYQLGMLYAIGKGVPQDDGQAWRWLEKAADQNHLAAQSYLAWINLLGLGQRENKEEAIRWFLMAHQQSFPSHPPLDKNIAFVHRPPESEYRQGLELVESRLSERDILDGLTLLEKAAEENYVPAQLYLAQLYHEGNPVKKNLTKAVEWYTQAAYNGDAQAQYALGWIYFYGEGVKEDREQAFEWFNRAHKQEARAKAALQFVKIQNAPVPEMKTISPQSPPSMKDSFQKFGKYLKSILPRRASS